MSEMLLYWLNNELQLSAHVSDVEQAFASGFLLGELLHRLNQQHNFSDFMDSTSADAKIINFCLLEPVLRRLQIKFDSKVATAIMNGKSGAAANVLYQIKMAAERLARAPGISTKSLERRNVLPLHNMPVKLAKPSYDAAHHYFFEHSVRRQVKSLGGLQHEREATEANKQRIRAYREQQARIQAQLEVTKAERLHQAFIHTQYIKTALDETDSPAWRLALATKSERERHKATFYRQLLAEKNHKEQEQAFSLRRAVEKDLGEFERRGATEKQKGGASIASRKSLGYGLRSLSTTLESTSSLHGPSLRDPSKPVPVGELTPEQISHSSMIRDQKQQRARRREQFERRRKRFLQEAFHGQSHANQSRLGIDLESIVQRTTHHEGESNKAMAKILIYKEIATENRLRRDEQYTSRREMDVHEAIDRDTAVFELLFAKYNDDWEIQSAQKIQRLAARAAAQQHENRLVAGFVLHEIISFAMTVAAHREDSMHSRDESSFLASEERWNELKFEFVLRGPDAMDADAEEDALLQHQFVHYLRSFDAPQFHSVNYVGVVTNGSKLSPWVPTNWKFVAAVEIVEDRLVLGETVKYLRWLVHANPPVPSPQPESLVLEAESALTREPAAESPSGDAVAQEEEVAEPVAVTAGQAVLDALQVPDVETGEDTVPVVDSDTPPQRSRLRVVLLGPPFAGKTTQAKLLADKYELELLSVERLLNEALSQQTALGVEVHALMAQGKEVPPQLYSRLVLGEIAQLEPACRNRWILYDLPSTQAHARSLEEHLTGFVDPSQIASPFDHESLLASGGGKPTQPKSFLHGKSGVDLAFYLDCAEASALERCLGALEDRETHDMGHHLLFAQPAVDAATRHRLQHVNRTVNASELLSLQCLSTEDRRDDAKQWFAQFDTLREVATTEWQPGESVAITRSLTPEATHRRLVECVDAFYAQCQAQADSRQRERELEEATQMQAEENRHWKLAELTNAIEQAQAEVARAQQAVQHAEETKAKKEEIAELRSGVEVAKKAVESTLVEAHDWRVQETLRVHNTNSVFSSCLVPSLAGFLVSLWDAMEREYTFVMTQCLKLQRQQRQRVETRVLWVIESITRVVRRADSKQTIVDAYQVQFNAVADEMRFDDATKNELHARTDVLQDELCLVATTKQRELHDELRAIMDDGWLEDTCQWLALLYQRALQAECDRFRISLQLLVDAFLAASDEPAQLAGIADQLKTNQQLMAELTLKSFAETVDESPSAAAVASAAAPAPAANAKGGGAAKGAAVKGKPPVAPVPAPVIQAAASTTADSAAEPLAPETLLLSYDMVIQRSESLLQLILIAPPKQDEATTAKTPETAAAPPPAHTKSGAKTGHTSAAATPDMTPVSSMALLPHQSIDVATGNFLKAARHEQELLARRVRFLKDAAQHACDHAARALRSVDARMRGVIEQRAVREEAAIGALVTYVRMAIEAETNLPFYIDIQPEQLYRFPVTQLLIQDTRVTVNAQQRLLERPAIDPPPEIESNHAVLLNERQANALRARLNPHHAGLAPLRTVVEVVQVLQMLQIEPHAMPKLWQDASEDLLAQIVGSFSDPEAGVVDTELLLQTLQSNESILLL